MLKVKQGLGLPCFLPKVWKSKHSPLVLVGALA
jgi:hypothetical protein